MLSLIKTAFAIILTSICSAIIGGIGLSFLTAYISGSVVGLHDLSYGVTMFFSTSTIAALLSGLIGGVFASPLRSQVFGSRSKGLAVAAVAFLIIALNTWFTLRSPQFYLRAMRYTDNHDPHTRSAYVKKLIAIGPPAIEPIIEQIKHSNTRSRGTWQLNVALKGLGENARGQLMQAIDAEKDDWSRIYLIYSLQKAFGDCSRIHLYLNLLAKTNNSFYAMPLWEQLNEYFQHEEEIPIIYTDGDRLKFTPEFVKWYQSKSVPKGPLPLWKPEPVR